MKGSKFGLTRNGHHDEGDTMNAKKTAKGHGLNHGDTFATLWDNEPVSVTLEWRKDAPHGPARAMYWIFEDGRSVPTGFRATRFVVI